ncbi:YgaP family membrane protein [Rufibacter quisquiliarum]|uniref:Inner membrane protein YgaP-like transmembrane domain-containing protein n=1 Tax=Rufibacter quisquiliarum TaxID=1549639 RepID=A0A839GMF1_9BACT|nr:DUF2892 domain-containing protein [Rufibacter quisquiliarum]MBA9079053.1 hypothetical protein [Rufibacter quisquiliarum]
MRKNMGNTDRIIRSSLAAGAATLIASKKVTGGVAIALGALATVFILTSSVGHCPAYAATGINTNTPGIAFSQDL